MRSDRSRFHRGRLAALLVALGTAAAPAFAAPETEESRLVAESQELIGKGDLRTALIQLKKAVKSNPNNPEARFSLGSLEFRTGDFLAAERDLIQAQEKGYAAAKVGPLLARTYLAEGKFQRVLTTAPPCSEDRICLEELSALRARAYLALHDLDNADKESLAALMGNPDGESGRITRALILSARNDDGGAEKIIDQVLAANPKLPEALVLKGELRRRANDADAAITNFHAALALDPTDLKARQSLALALMMSGRDKEAWAEINQVLERTPASVMALYLKAVLLLRERKSAEALDTVRPVEAAIAQSPQGAFLLALVHSASNNMEEALGYATTFHAAEPDNLVGAKLLANIEFRLRAYDKVVSVLAPLRDRLSEDGEALDLLGAAYLAQGRITESNELLSAVVKAQPDNPLARARLAISQTRDSSTREAGIQELETLVHNTPDNLQIDLALVSTYIGTGDYDRAIAAATTMIQNQPESALPLTIRGAARLAKGDHQAARGDFEAARAKNPDYVPAAVYLAELDMLAGDFDQARERLDDVHKRKPADLSALLARAQIEIRANKPAAAVPFLETAIHDHPAEREPRLRLIQAEISLGDGEKAALNANDLARSLPRDPTAIDFSAKTLFSLGKGTEGLELYRKLLVIFPESPQIHERAGQALVALGRLDEARSAFDQAIAADQRYLPAWVSRVGLERKTNGLDAAMVIAEKAAAKNPDDPAAAVLPGDLLLVAGNLDQAEERLRKLFEQKPSPTTANRLFQLLTRKGDPDAADAFLAQWIGKSPGDTEARIALADHQLSREKYQDAAAQYETILQTFPRNAGILNNLAWAYRHLNDTRALSMAERAYAIAPDAPAIMDTYGYFLYLDGQRKLGADLVSRAFQVAPQDSQVAYHRAKILADDKDAAGARGILQGLVGSKVAFDGADDARKLYAELGGL